MFYLFYFIFVRFNSLKVLSWSLETQKVFEYQLVFVDYSTSEKRFIKVIKENQIS